MVYKLYLNKTVIKKKVRLERWAVKGQPAPEGLAGLMESVFLPRENGKTLEVSEQEIKSDLIYIFKISLTSPCLY